MHVASQTKTLNSLLHTNMPVRCLCNLRIVYGTRIPDLDMLLIIAD